MKSQHAAAHPSPCSAALNFLLTFPELQLLISVWETAQHTHDGNLALQVVLTNATPSLSNTKDM